MLAIAGQTAGANWLNIFREPISTRLTLAKKYMFFLKQNLIFKIKIFIFINFFYIPRATPATPVSILYLDKLRILRQRAGFISLNRGEISKAAELLMSGRTDIREILFLYPGIVVIR